MNSLSSSAQIENRLPPAQAALLFGAALFRFINLGFLDLQAWDEALYAVRAQAILRAGLWLDQTSHAIDGLYSSLHPPFYVWATAIAYQLFGESEFAARFFATLSGGLTVFVIYFIGRELRSKETGLVAALLYSLNPFTVFFSRQGQFDSLLVLFLALSALGLIISIQRIGRKGTVVAGILVGCALMTKLFVAFGIPVAYVLWILIVRPENRKEHWIRTGIIIMLASAVSGPWHVYMTVVHGNGDPFFFLGSSAVVQRTLFGIEGNVKPLEVLYYVNQLIVLFPFGLAAFLHGSWESYQARRPLWLFTIIWFSFFFLVFSLMRTKLAVYLLPMLIPASLLAGSTLDSMAQGNLQNKDSRWIIFATVFFGIWSFSQTWRDSVKGMISSLLSLQAPSLDNLTGTFLLLSTTIFGIGISWVLLRGPLVSRARLFPPLLLLAMFCLSSSAIVITDRYQYNDGAAALTEHIAKSKVNQIVVAGYERNPQLTYYLAGADIGWRDDLHVRRIIPPSDSTLYRTWIQQEMIGEPAYTLLVIEKDKFIRYHTINPQSFLADGYVRVFESRRYAAFVAGRVDFLASANPKRN